MLSSLHDAALYNAILVTTEMGYHVDLYMSDKASLIFTLTTYQETAKLGWSFRVSKRDLLYHAEAAPLFLADTITDNVRTMEDQRRERKSKPDQIRPEHRPPTP